MRKRVTTGRVAPLLALVVAGLTIPAPSSAPAAEEDPRPNILIIVTDDQRADAMDHMPATKRIFARGGTTFTNGFVTTPFCCPSRASIMTGKYSHNHGIRSGSELDQLPAIEEMSIQKELQAAGYKTALFGKFLNSWPLRRDPRYLDKWAVIPNISPDGYYDGRWNVDGRIKTIRQYSTAFLRDLAMDFVRTNERNDGKPWFLYIAPAAPHFPYDTEPKYRGKAVSVWRGNPAVQEQDRTDKPAWVQARDAALRKGQTIRRRQLRTLMSVDDLVAKLFRQLEELGETDTLAVYTSDNGYLWGEHGATQKRWPYIPSVNVPYLVRWPGYLPTGVVSDRLVANIDIAPSIAHATGTPFTGFDGKSWFDSEPRDRLLLEFWKRRSGNGLLQDWAATLTPEYHYIEYYDMTSGALLDQEYYDLVADPWELENLLGDTSLTNDPTLLEMQDLTNQLNEDRQCAGPEECP